MNKNTTELSKKIASAIVKEISEQGGFDKDLVSLVVKGIDLEDMFINETIASIVTRLKELSQYPQFQNKGE